MSDALEGASGGEDEPDLRQRLLDRGKVRLEIENVGGKVAARYKSMGGRGNGGRSIPSPSSAPGNLAVLHNKPSRNTRIAENEKEEMDVIRAVEELTPSNLPVMDQEEDEALLTGCGIGRHRPRCLQMFATANWMLFWLCWFCTVQGMLVNGLVPSVLSTIERRFQFSSSMLGRIMQFYDIGYVLCCIPVSYFGGRHSQPLFLGLGLLIMGCGSFLFSMPHIVSDPYNQKGDTQKFDTPGCYKNFSTVLHNSTCVSKNDSPVISDRMWYLALFCFAHFLHGIGATPLFTLGVSYIDENVNPLLSPVYIGIFYAFAIFGPAAGFLMSGTFLRYHTDFLQTEIDIDITEIDETDPSWVGAWWIGFQLASILSVLAVFPILSFPKVLPGAIEMYKNRIRRENKEGIKTRVTPQLSAPPGGAEESRNGPRRNDHPPLAGTSSAPPAGAVTRIKKEEGFLRRFWADVQHIPRAVSRLLTNPGYMFITLAAAVDGLLITGLSAFMAKYLERQFNIRSSRSNMLIGCIMVPFAGLASGASGFIIQRFRMTGASTLKFCITMVVFSLVLSPMFLVYCDHSLLVGVETHYPPFTTSSSSSSSQAQAHGNESVDVKSECNSHCQCTLEFHPVCSDGGKDDLSFYSPCFAGCQEPFQPLRTTYSNCSCAPTRTVKKGLCESKCSGLFGFLVLFAPMVFCTFSVGVPALTVVLRCVEHKERSFALGIQWILIRLIGTIPAPAVFGWFFDVACKERYRNQCTGADGSCFVYNNKLLADLFLAFALIGQTGTLLFFVLSLIFYRREPLDEESPKPENVNLEDVYLNSARGQLFNRFRSNM